MSGFRLAILGMAFLGCAAFSNDSAGRACVQAKGQRGVAYNLDQTKVSDAYSPNGRRLIEDGHRLYQIDVPPLVKRDPGISCTMRLANGLWRAPAPNPFQSGDITPRETPGSGLR